VQITKRNKAVTERYTVLVLDTSESMLGEPLKQMKDSAKIFVKSVMDASGDNKVALIAFNSLPDVMSGFVGVDKLNIITDHIGRLRASGGTNVADAVLEARKLLDAVALPDRPDITYNIVLLSDGIPNDVTGALQRATEAKDKGYYIYTLGYFHTVGFDVQGRIFLENCQNGGYFDVKDSTDLEFAFGQIANDIRKLTGPFTYGSSRKQPGTNTYRDYVERYYYDDAYFSGPSRANKPSAHLSTMSLCLAMSAFNSNNGGDDYSNRSGNAQKLLKDLGFSGVAVNKWFTQMPESDSIGVIAGSKDLEYGGKDYTLIAVAIRGGGYQQEWASNVTVGMFGDHEGFSEAKDNVLKFLEQYVSHYDITGNIKLWITGYSRGGAVANLVGGALDGGKKISENVTLELDDMFVYTFEAPKGSVYSLGKTDKYRNIFNIVNPNDIMTYIAPGVWNFTSYGTDAYVPNAATFSEYYWLKFYMEADYYSKLNAVGPSESPMDSFRVLAPIYGKDKTPSNQSNPRLQGDFSNFIITSLATDVFYNRYDYAAINQDAMRRFIELFGVGLYNLADRMLDNMTDPEEETSILYNDDIILLTLIPLFLNNVAVTADELGIEGATPFELAGIAFTVGQALFESARKLLLLDITTLFMNKDAYLEAHSAELCLAWLMSRDSYYSATNTAFERTDSKHRVVRINCPVDVEAYNSKGELVLQIIDNVPQDILGGLASYVDGDEKIAYFPPDESYEVKVKATDDGYMTYMVTEEDFSGSVAPRAVVFNQVELVKGEVFTGELPAYSEEDYELEDEATDTSYTLADSSGALIEPTSDGSLESVSFSINVESSDDSLGEVLGQTTLCMGQSATVIAVANDTASFDGWYEDGEKVEGADRVYEFGVQSDRELVARFVANESPETEPEPGDEPDDDNELTPSPEPEDEPGDDEPTPSPRPGDEPGDSKTLTPTPVSSGSATPAKDPMKTPAVSSTKTPTPKYTATPSPKYTATPSPKSTATPSTRPTSTPSTRPTATPSSGSASGSGTGTSGGSSQASATPSAGGGAKSASQSPMPATNAPEDALHKLGLLAGTGTGADGKPNFDLDKKLTRLESLALVIRLMGLEEESRAYTGTNTFNDVPEWGDRYAAFGYQAGITAGINSEHTLFAPDRQVTFQEFTAFLLRVLGYTEANGDFKYEYAIRKADEIKLFDPYELNRISTDNFLRQNAVFEMVDLLMTKAKGSEELQIDLLAKKGTFSKEDAKWFVDSAKLME
jgi:uncharacterized protein YegL